MELPLHCLLDHEQRVKIGASVSKPGYPNGGVPQVISSGSKDAY